MQCRACGLAIVTLILQFLTVGSASAQKTIVVAGRVVDAQTQEPLVGANVFIDNTTNGTSTDTQGRFSFSIEPGKVTIVVSYLGYESFNKTVVAKVNTDYTVDAKLKPMASSLDEISITAKRDKTWEALLDRFQLEFFGAGKNGVACKIANPWVLDLAESNGLLTASSIQPLIITNPELGYKIFFHLQSFEEKNHEYRIKGHVQFVPMVPQSSAELVRWNQKRFEAYRGSLRHFLRSMIRGDFEQQGFRVYMDKAGYERKYRSPLFSQDLIRAVDSVSPGGIPIRIHADSTFGIQIERRIEIHYLKKTSKEKLYKDVDNQVSWVNPERSMILSNVLGIVSDSLDLSVSGSMSDYRVGELLPLDIEFTSIDEINQIEGTVVDAESKRAISDGQVFVNKSTFGTYTKSDGSFSFGGLTPGFYDVLIYAPGFELTKSRMKVEDGRSYKLKFELNPVKRKVPSAKSKTNERVSDRLTRELVSIFLGQFKDSCRLENKSAIAWIESQNGAQASASAPLKFVNYTLGYTVNYILEKVSLSEVDTTLTGYYWFETMSPQNEVEINTWVMRRNERYKYSKQFFLRSALATRLSQRGFRLYPLDGDSAIKVYPTPPSLKGYTGLVLSDSLRITYRGMGNISAWYNQKGANRIKAKSEKPIFINSSGFIFDEAALRWRGRLDEKSIAVVPIDFEPVDDNDGWNNVERLGENLVFQMNKSYYYRREFIWLSGYLFPNEYGIRDSLSQTIHVELLNPEGSVVSENLAKVDNGTWSASVFLQDTLKEGSYYLRVYSGWMRNFRDEIQVKRVPIIGYTTNFADIDASPAVEQTATYDVLSINTERVVYPKRNRILVQAKPTTELVDGDQIVYASVSVTDVNAVKQIDTNWISSSAPKGERYLDGRYNVIERGVCVSGVLLDKQNGVVQGKVEILNMDYQIFEEVQTDALGRFTFNAGVDFYDSTDFYFRGFSKKGEKAFVKLDEPAYPEFKKPDDLSSSIVSSENMLARIQNSYQPRENVTVLAEVTVEGKKIDDSRANSSKAERSAIIYGQPDKVFTGEEILNWGTASNWTEGLNGRVPGVKVTNGRISIRGQSSFSGNDQPLYLVNGVPSTLEVNPHEIERVEIVKRLVSVYGSLGANGIIAIYTKSASTNASAANVSAYANLDYQRLKLKGYTKSLNFRHPDYSTPGEERADFRTTLYWNPKLEFNNGLSEFSFFSADIETSYRIQIVGVTKLGKTFVSEALFSVR